MRQRDRKEVLTVRMPKDVHDALRTLSLATDTSMNDLVLRAVRDYLASKKHREAVSNFLSEAQKQYRVTVNRLAGL